MNTYNILYGNSYAHHHLSQCKRGRSKINKLRYTALELRNRGYKVRIIDTDPQGTIVRSAEKFPLEVSLYGEKDLKRYKPEPRVITLIDTPPGLLNVIEAAEKISDQLVIPSSYGALDIAQTLRTYQGTTAPAKILLTSVNKRAVLYKETVQQLLDLEVPLYETRIRRLMSMVELPPRQNSQTKKWRTLDYTDFVDELMAEIKDTK